jgi:hypothetical protein
LIVILAPTVTGEGAVEWTIFGWLLMWSTLN